MFNRKTLILLLGLFFIISTLTFVYADRDYSIDEAFLNLTVHDNGLVHIDECYNYNFIGTFNGVTRDIPLKSGESIENLQVSAIGAYPELVERFEDGYLKLKIYLYADEAHTQKIHDTDVQVFISYDMVNLTTVYRDTVSIQYKIWGDEWDKRVGKLTTNINLPGSSGNMYWLNPSQYNLTSSLNGNHIHSVSTSIPSGEFFELQLLMPTDEFTNSPYALHIDKNAKDEILKIQEDYKNSEVFYDNLYLITGIIFLFSPIILIGLYLKYGRDPKIEYQGLYEREPPTNDAPAMVNAIIQEHASEKPSLKGFEATIMDLINRKIIGIETIGGDENKQLILHLHMEKTDSLNQQEKHLINLLNRFANNQTLNLQNFKNQLKIEMNAKYFKEQYELWRGICRGQYIENLSKYFIKKGKTITIYFGIIGLILGGIVAYMALGSGLPNSIIALIGSAILLATSLLCLILPNDVFGHWTKEGKEYSDKWKNFKKFLKDNSLLNQHPPESIVIWNQYLVYATALGVADNVYKSMKIHIPSDYYTDDLYTFHMYGGYWLMHDSFNAGFSAAVSDSSSGLGGIGGGSGGGGGGAF